MNRRGFLEKAGLGFGALGLPYHLGKSSPAGRLPVSFSLNANRVSYFSEAFNKPARIFFAADTHLWHSDQREDPYYQYSKRMAAAYNHTTHFQTNQPTDPKEAFEATLRLAQEKDIDLLVLAGDIFSYPSEAAIDWAYQKLQQAGIPYLYTNGNHDWHYEGMEGSLAGLRSEWSGKRLIRLFQGGDPLMAYRDIHEVRCVVIDNSIYEILPEQLEWYRKVTSTNKYVVLMMHIPLYSPGRSVFFGCGHPQWNAAHDRNFKIERREPWPEAGHTSVTMDFYREVWNTPNLLGVFCGHIHAASTDILSGIPQLVTPPNFTGGYLSIDFRSPEEKKSS